jgi:O-antigen/teichoic acid export membrane protein
MWKQLIYHGIIPEEYYRNLQERSNPMSLAKKTTFGVLWNFAEQLCRRGTGVIITLLLARFLTPEHYGLIAMMQVFLVLGQSLMDSGFSQALIRLPNAKPVDFNTAFFSNIALGLLSYSILFLVAPFIAIFYNTPELILLIRVASISIIISSFQVVQVAQLTRKLNFKIQLKASFPAAIISGLTAIALAYHNFGVWALIVQMIMATLLTTCLLWYYQGWRPSFTYSRQSFLHMFNFGYKLYLSSIIDTIFVNMYVIVISKIFAASIAGYYFFAEKIKNLLVAQLLTSIQNVTYPALASLQEDDVKLKSGFRKVISVMCFIYFPALLFLAVTAPLLFETFLPNKWHNASPYLQMLCLAGLLMPLHMANLNIIKVKGRSDLFLYLEVIKKVISVSILFYSYRFGVYGILTGQIFSSIICYFPNSYYSSKLIAYTVREQLSDTLPILFLAFSSASITFLSLEYISGQSIIKLVISLTIGITFYLLTSKLIKSPVLAIAMDLIKNDRDYHQK